MILPSQIVTGNKFKTLAHNIIDGTPTKLTLTPDKNIFFLKTDYYDIFVSLVLPQIYFKFKVISHNSDYPIEKKHINTLDHPCLVQWYGMNTSLIHYKLTPIPIGLANEKWPHGDIPSVVNAAANIGEKKTLCYSNFDINTTSSRSQIQELILSKKFIFNDIRKPFKEYLTSLSQSKYVISPRGNSVDCHRIWEAIYVGTIPIIESSIAMEYFYDLPILVVDSFEELTEDMLEDKYDKIKNRRKDKAYMQFYEKLILEVSEFEPGS